MSGQTNNEQNTNDNQNGRGFDAIVEFCQKNILYIAGAVVVILLVIILFTLLGGKDEEKPLKETEALTEETEEPEDYTTDAYPQINELINKYYKAYAKGNTKKIAALADPVSDAEKSYISEFSKYVKKYKNISCYTKKGMDDSSYIVSVYMEIKFNKIKTTAPGLETFYIRTREDGTFYIDNLYGLFNSKMDEYPVDDDVIVFIENFSQQEDVIALQTEIQQKYEAALASDEDLKTFIESTIPNDITVWASEQAAAAKKAEEERVAAEEAEKKAAEEEAAKKAEEEKKAEELASAVIVYATDKVNVRAEASETAEVLGQLEIGSKTTRLEDKDGWSRIDYNNGTQGYVKSEYLSTEAPTAAEEPAAAEQPTASTGGSLQEGAVITIQQSVNLRKSMGEDAEKIATVFAGEKVTVIMSYAEGWTKVTYGDKTGFIKTELLQ